MSSKKTLPIKIGSLFWPDNFNWEFANAQNADGDPSRNYFGWQRNCILPFKLDVDLNAYMLEASIKLNMKSSAQVIEGIAASNFADYLEAGIRCVLRCASAG